MNLFYELICFASVICLSEAEESRRVNSRVNALGALSEPHEVFWTDTAKAAIVVQFQDRVDQVQVFFEKCRDSLAMVYQTMFPLNPQPESLLALMAKFKNHVEVQIGRAHV